MKSFISRIVLVAVALSFPFFAHAQWVAPTLAPPSGNASIPLNLSNTGQTKLGGLTLNTGGAAYGLIVSSGNVGIGSLIPTLARLDVAQSSVSSPGTAIKFGSQGFLVSTATNISDNAYWNGTAWTNVNTAASSRMYLNGGGAGFFTAPSAATPNWTERLTILNNGDVGIGATSPGAKLEVAGQVKITGGTPGAGKVLTSDAAGLATWTTPSAGTMGGSGTTNYVPKFTAATTLGNSIIFDNGTNVGIGTVSPQARLSLGTSVANTKLALYDDTVGPTIYGLGIQANQFRIHLDQSASRFSFLNAPAGTELFTILGTGNVGIGTASPAQKLDVSAWAIFGDSTQTNIYLRDDESTSGPKRLHANSNVAGFLNGAGSWMVYWDTVGNQTNAGTIAATQFNGSGAGLTGTASSLTAGNVNALSGTWDGISYFRSNKGASSYVGANNTYALEAYSSDGGAAGMSFHRGGAYAVNMGLDPDNVFRIGGWSAASNRLQLDMSGNLTLAGSVTGTAFYYSSDKNLKTNISPLKDSLSKVLKLDGVSFNWKEGGRPSVGVIAQDIEKVYPELVNTDAKTGLKSVEYGNLVAPLIEAVKEQQKQIDGLKAEIEILKSKK